MLAILGAAGCSPATDDREQNADRITSTVVGTIENNEIDEASGLARSQRSPDVLWVINDDGPSVLHAIDATGGMLGRVKIKDASNRDWEDLASFTLDGTPYLLVADIGDNDGKRKDVRFYVLEEPDPGEKKVDYAWRVDFSYPAGPRDAESIAVDVENERVLILTKRDIPARLYSVPLRPDSKKRQEAAKLGSAGGLPQPRRRDIEFAPRTNDYYWQPTSMDISDDGTRAVVLTYGGVFLFERQPGASWADALQGIPAVVSRTRNREAESITFNGEGNALFVTLEQRNSPLIRLPLESPAAAVTVMAFNVQNVFDNVDDPEKDDKAYLPIGDKQADAHIAECNEIPVQSWRDECLNLDWSDAAIDHKLSVVAESILQVDNGHGADIIALQEIENIEILEQLRSEYLMDAGYLPPVLIEGTDKRGIDVAFLSRLPVVDSALHPLDLPPEFADRAGDTRGLLEATFELPGGSRLTGFSVHLPAPFHPTEMRVIAYEHLNRVLEQVPRDHNVFAAGDFNTTSTEDEEHNMLERFVRPNWAAVSNDLCNDCLGSHYYSRNDVWSFLDMVVFRPSDDPDRAWQVASVELANSIPAQVTKDGTPNRYRSAERTGVSDHWPVLMTLERRP